MFQETQRELFQTLEHQLIMFQVEIGESSDCDYSRIVVGANLGENVFEC